MDELESSSDESEDEDWCAAAGKDLLQDVPKYREFCGPETRREVKFIDPEQLVDYMRYYKEAGLTEYQDVSFNYARMTNYAPFNPKTYPVPKSNCNWAEVGLSNSVVLSGKGTFDGEEAKEDINIILKLRTMITQPEVEVDSEFSTTSCEVLEEETK